MTCPLPLSAHSCETFFRWIPDGLPDLRREGQRGSSDEGAGALGSGRGRRLRVARPSRRWGTRSQTNWLTMVIFIDEGGVFSEKWIVRSQL